MRPIQPIQGSGLAFVVACTLALAFATASAAGPSDSNALELRERIVDVVRAHVDGDVSRVEVPSLSRFSVAGSPDLRIEVDVRGRSSRPNRVPVEVALFDAEDDRLLRRGVVNADVQGERRVAVAKRALRPGETLNLSDLSIEARPLADLPRDAVSDPRDLVGQRVRRGVRRGAALQADFVEEAPLVARGQRVRILVQRGALRIEMVGQAKEEGRAGDWIRLTNDRSRKEVIGRVGLDGVVHVDL